ncbi:MAG: NlpC/P60 family protein [Butyricicoccus sp.]
MNSSKRLIKIAVTSAIAATLSISAASALYVGETTASSLNLRATPGGTAIGSLPYGTKLAVISNSDDWYQVAVNGQTAYVSGAYVSWIPDTEFALGTGVIQCSTSVNFRELPNTDCAVLASLPNGTKVELIGVAQGWYKANINGQKGFISADYVSVTGGTAVDKSAVYGSTTVSSSSGVRQAILDYAAQFLGTPYVYGGSTPSGFDCSGFTSYVYKNVATPIARTSYEQRATTKNISMDELLPGDLVFFGSGGSVNHVGIYTGNGQFIHSPHTGSVVKYDSLSSGSYNTRFICGGRVLAD